MRIVDTIKVPTGHILTVRGEKGYLECLSIGDYGKEANLKADFLGLNRKIKTVKHQEMLPLEKKWIITISTQYGCSMGCKFCDVPKVGPGKNASVLDMLNQIYFAQDLHPEVEQTERLNIHFARMGEPTWNDDVLLAAKLICQENPKMFPVHPVVSTMMPRYNKSLFKFLANWMHLKNITLEGNAGLQLSINSTDEEERSEQFNKNACTLKEMSENMKNWPVEGRKITLNFAIANYTIDPDILLQHFSPDQYLIKLTPMHKTTTALEQGIKTDGDYTTMHPYETHEEALKKAGYDVIVFIASKAEDEGRITCGNAVLSGTRPFGAGLVTL